MAEPSFFAVSETTHNDRLDTVKHAINPYAPPFVSPAKPITLEALAEEAMNPTLARRFFSGHPFIHYGIIFFLDTSDDTAIHAALPLASLSESLVDRSTKEAMRVLPEFLGTLPNATKALAGRNLIVRMISSYAALDTQVCARGVVPWAAIRPINNEPAPAERQGLEGKHE